MKYTSLRSPVAILAAALVAAAILYFPATGYPFLYDDNKQILGNENIQGWHGFARAFSVPLWSFDEWKGGGRHYRPMYSIWFTLCWLLFGDEAAGWHVLCLLLHGASVLGVWFMGTALGVNRRACAGAALLFAVHPINIQAATWVSASTDTIAAIGILASCALWVRACEQDKPKRLLSATAAMVFLLAALTLERAWTCAILPPLYVWLQGRNRVIRTGILFALPLALVLVLRAVVLSGYEDGAAAGRPGVGQSLLTAPVLALRYLQNALLPLNLSLAYPEIADGAIGIRLLAGVLAIAATAGAVVLLSRGSRRRQFLALAAALPFLPALYAGVLQSSDLVQDRYLYLPLAFGSLWLADVAADTWSRGRRWRVATATLALIWTALLVVFFRPNLRIWSHELALYGRATEVAPENPKHLMGLSIALRRNDPEADPDCELLSRARELRAQGKPGVNDVVLSFNTGNCHRKQGRMQIAIAEYGRADRLSAGRFHPARRNMVATMVDSGRLSDALAVTESLTRDFPRAGWSWRLQGVVLARMDRYAEAERVFLRALELDPSDDKSHSMLLESRARRASLRPQ